MTKQIPWNTGDGNITLTYNGQGNDSVIVDSDINEDEDSREQVLTFSGGGIARQVTVIQEACPVNFRTSEGDIIKTADGDYFNVAEPEIINYVDLGLPSGLLWAQGNIVKDANGVYAIGEPTDYGCYFSWGNIDGHNSGEGYDWGNGVDGPYASTPGAQVSTNIASNDTDHDAALACLGAPWHLPTSSNFQELYDYTDNEWTTIDGINGWKFMNKDNHSIYIFLPTAGFGYRTWEERVDTRGFYWSSSYSSYINAYNMYFYISSMAPQSSNERNRGFPVRAVKSAN